MLLTALIVMSVTVLAQHLGLSDAVANVVSKILKCPKCLTFWTVLFVLIVIGCDPFLAMGLSVLMAYLSAWCGLLLYLLNQLYDWIWQRISRQDRAS